MLSPKPGRESGNHEPGDREISEAPAATAAAAGDGVGSNRIAKTRREIVEALREQIGQSQAGPVAARLSSGCEALDGLLPHGGLRPGVLVEWVSEGSGGGAGTLAVAVARQACREGGMLVVVDRRGEFYPPAAAGQGIDLDRMMVVRPATAADEWWALEQVLRSRGVSAVLVWLEQEERRSLRRLQLAAEAGGGVGLLICPESFAKAPYWSEARLLVRPLPSEGPRRMRVQTLHCRGAASGAAVTLEIDNESGALRLASELAPAAAGRRPAGT